MQKVHRHNSARIQKTLWNPKGLQLVRDITTDYSDPKSTDDDFSALIRDPFVSFTNTDYKDSSLGFEALLDVKISFVKEVMPKDSGFWGNTYFFGMQVSDKMNFLILVTTNETTPVSSLDDSSVVLSYALSESLKRHFALFFEDFSNTIVENYSPHDIYKLVKNLQVVCQTAYEELFVFLEKNSFEEKYGRSISDALSSLDVSIYSFFRPLFSEDKRNPAFVCMHTLGRAVTDSSSPSIGGNKGLSGAPTFNDSYKNTASLTESVDSWATSGPVSFESLGLKKYDDELFGDKKIKLSGAEDLYLSFWQRMDCITNTDTSKMTPATFRVSLSRDAAGKSKYYTKMHFSVALTAEIRTAKTAAFTVADIRSDLVQAVLDCFTPASSEDLRDSTYLKLAKISPTDLSANKNFSWERFIATIEKFKNMYPPRDAAITQEAIDKTLGLLFEFNKHSIMRSFCDIYSKMREGKRNKLLNGILFWYNDEYQLDPTTLRKIFSDKKVNILQNTTSNFFYAPFFLAELYLSFLAILKYWAKGGYSLNNYKLPELKDRDELVRPMDSARLIDKKFVSTEDYVNAEGLAKNLTDGMIFKPVETFLSTRKALYPNAWNANMQPLNYDLFATATSSSPQQTKTQPSNKPVHQIKSTIQPQQSTTTSEIIFSDKQKTALAWFEANKNITEEFPEVPFEISEGLFEAAFLMYHEDIVDYVISTNGCLSKIANLKTDILKIVKERLGEYVALAGTEIYAVGKGPKDTVTLYHPGVLGDIVAVLKSGKDFTFGTLKETGLGNIVKSLAFMLKDSSLLQEIWERLPVVVCQAEKYWEGLDRRSYALLVNGQTTSTKEFADKMGMLFFTAYYNSTSNRIAAEIKKKFKQYKGLPDTQISNDVIIAKQKFVNFKNSILNAYKKLNPPEKFRIASGGKRVHLPAEDLIEKSEMEKMIASAMAKEKLSASENEWFLKKDVLKVAFFDLFETLDALISATSTSAETTKKTVEIDTSKAVGGGGEKTSKIEVKPTTPAASTQTQPTNAGYKGVNTYTASGVNFNLVSCEIEEGKQVSMGETEVTQELFEAVMGWNTSYHTNNTQRPVEMVTWYDCVSFCNKLSNLLDLEGCYEISDEKKNGRHITKATVKWDETKNGFRLPTDNEWVFFAKAGTDNEWSGTDDVNVLDLYAWYEKGINGKTYPVGKFQSNEWGLYDMSGNVWEWCWDLYDPEDDTPQRVVRGGSYWDNADDCRVAFRYGRNADDWLDFQGFRLCRSSGSSQVAKPKDTSSKSTKPTTPAAITQPTAVVHKGVNTYTANDVNFNLVSCEIEEGKQVSMGKTEVTQELFEAVMGWNASYHTNNTQRPVESVTWYDCISFCNKLSSLLGLEECYTMSDIRMSLDGKQVHKATVKWDKSKNGFRLPTEYEWELFAKAGTDNEWSGTNGEKDLKDYAWYFENSGNKTHPVGTRLPNEWGLYDMSGNVWEWCWDLYDPEDTKERVVRGGCYWNLADGCRVAYRDRSVADSRNYYQGFRLCRSSDSSQAKDSPSENTSISGQASAKNKKAKPEIIEVSKTKTAKVAPKIPPKGDIKELKADLKKLLSELNPNNTTPTEAFVDLAANSVVNLDYATGSEIEAYQMGSAENFAVFVQKFCMFLNASNIGSGKALPKGAFYVDGDIKNRVYSGAGNFMLDLYPNLILCMFLDETGSISTFSGVEDEGRVKYEAILERPEILVEEFKKLS